MYNIGDDVLDKECFDSDVVGAKPFCCDLRGDIDMAKRPERVIAELVACVCDKNKYRIAVGDDQGDIYARWGALLEPLTNSCGM